MKSKATNLARHALASIKQFLTAYLAISVKALAAVFVAASLGACATGNRAAGASGQMQWAANETAVPAASAAAAPDPEPAAGIQRIKQGLQPDGSVIFRGYSKDWLSEESNKRSAMGNVEEKFATYLSGPEFSREVGGFLKSYPVLDSDGRKLKVSIEEKFARLVWHSLLLKVKIPALEWTDDWPDQDGRVWVEGMIRPEAIRQLRVALAAAAIREEIEAFKLKRALSKEAEDELERLIRNMGVSSKSAAASAQ